ncbi:hypothetical protein FQA39_LY01375 [Lamprigera yunnana]|nr:hypothetical protein FQA39_LY01375 [Lamprigera yunnana]
MFRPTAYFITQVLENSNSVSPDRVYADLGIVDHRNGDLLVICSNEKRWWPRKVMVRGGQLLIGSSPGDSSFNTIRLPLRHLSLAAGPLPNSFALYRGQNIILTIQTASERAFKLWIKTIAIELIRQTPLEAVKYLDILNLADCWNKKDKDCKQDWNCNYINHDRHHCKYCNLPKRENNELCVQENDERKIEVLIKRCQNSDNYVPVKEKLVLFESLCRFGRKVRSTEDVSVKISIENKRALSMHDLSNNSITGVRQICKYFEKKTDQQNDLLKYTTVQRPNKRLINIESNLRHRKENIFCV